MLMVSLLALAPVGLRENRSLRALQGVPLQQHDAGRPKAHFDRQELCRLRGLLLELSAEMETTTGGLTSITSLGGGNQCESVNVKIITLWSAGPKQ